MAPSGHTRRWTNCKGNRTGLLGQRMSATIPPPTGTHPPVFGGRFLSVVPLAGKRCGLLKPLCSPMFGGRSRDKGSCEGQRGSICVDERKPSNKLRQVPAPPCSGGHSHSSNRPEAKALLTAPKRRAASTVPPDSRYSTRFSRCSSTTDPITASRQERQIVQSWLDLDDFLPGFASPLRGL